MTETLLFLRDITFQYPESSWRLAPVSFSIGRGEIVAILGPNGSGKSTLLRLAAGVLKPIGGEVFLDGRNVNTLGRRAIARRLGYLPQNTESHFDYSVEEVVAMGRFPRLGGLGFLGQRDLAVIQRSLEQTATETLRNRPLSRLSGGERQRAMLASVLAQEPQVLLLDEPTNALDIHHQMRFFSILSSLVHQGLAVVIVTHDLNLASLYSQRIFLMKAGRMVQEGHPEEVLTQQILYDVYGEGLELMSHPTHLCPIVLPTVQKRKENNSS